MNSHEFTLWLHGYLEALESEGIDVCKIKNIREKMSEIKMRPNQERVVFGPNVKQPQQQGYVNPDNNRPII
jgi:hypothetical protein